MTRDPVLPRAVCHECGHSWLAGLLFVMAFLLASGWLREWDERTDADHAIAVQTLAISKLNAQLTEAERAPQVRLEGQGYECRLPRTRHEWTPAIRAKCEELAMLLRAGRTGE